MIYNEEQWELIKKASPHYATVQKDYIRNAPRWLTEEIINAYESATGKELIHKNLNCSVCVLNLYKIIAKTYFQDLEERENKINENAENINKPIDNKKQKPKNKKVEKKTNKKTKKQ